MQTSTWFLAAGVGSTSGVPCGLAASSTCAARPTSRHLIKATVAIIVKTIAEGALTMTIHSLLAVIASFLAVICSIWNDSSTVSASFNNQSIESTWANLRVYVSTLGKWMDIYEIHFISSNNLGDLFTFFKLFANGVLKFSVQEAAGRRYPLTIFNKMQ